MDRHTHTYIHIFIFTHRYISPATAALLTLNPVLSMVLRPFASMAAAWSGRGAHRGL